MIVLLEYIKVTALLEYVYLFTIQVAEKWTGQTVGSGPVYVGWGGTERGEAYENI